ncbi:MAG: cytochrome c3 family protein [Bacteroidota bacterium]
MKTKFFISVLFCALIVNAQNQKHETRSDGLTCKSCHSIDIPTKENPALKPCPREKMISIDQLPEEGPVVLTIDKFREQTDIYAPVVFSHLLHAEMSGMSGGCRMCHHYNPPGQVIGCSDCHELARKRIDVSKPDLKGAYHRQCLDCHRSWSSSVDCLQCHQQNGITQKNEAQKFSDAGTTKRIHPKIITPTTLKFDTPKASGKIVTFYHSEHTNLFGLECQSCHSNESCGRCHAKNKTAQLKTKTAEEKHAVCSNCHNTKLNCSSCHSNYVKEGFNHKERTGFDSAKFHSKLSCIRCHVEKKKFSGLNRECINCHGKWTQENFKHKITGVVLDETHAALECRDCHQEKNFENPVCKDCHEDKSFPKNVPGKIVSRG